MSTPEEVEKVAAALAESESRFPYVELPPPRQFKARARACVAISAYEQALERNGKIILDRPAEVNFGSVYDGKERIVIEVPVQWLQEVSPTIANQIGLWPPEESK